MQIHSCPRAWSTPIFESACNLVPNYVERESSIIHYLILPRQITQATPDFFWLELKGVGTHEARHLEAKAFRSAHVSKSRKWFRCGIPDVPFFLHWGTKEGTICNVDKKQACVLAQGMTTTTILLDLYFSTYYSRTSTGY
jgi:hypothetical protein